MNFGYSAKDKAFVILDFQQRYEKNDKWPADVIAVTNSIWQEYAIQPPQGKVLDADSEGMPCWVDAPAVSAEEQSVFDENEKEVRLEKAEREIYRLSVVKDVCGLSEDEEARLKNWKEHLVKIYRSVPERGKAVEWPSPPG